MYAKKENPVYVSKRNSNREKQVILLMIPNGEGWHSSSKKLSTLLRGIKSKYHGDFYCLNCLHSFTTEIKRESHQKVYVKIKIFVTLQCPLKAQKY